MTGTEQILEAAMSSTINYMVSTNQLLFITLLPMIGGIQERFKYFTISTKKNNDAIY